MSGTSMTAQEIVATALRKLGVVNRRDTINSQEMEDGLEALWMLLDSWNTQSFMIPFYTKLTFPIDPSKREYTIGPNGDFDVPRPLEIIEAYWTDPVGTSYRMTRAGVQDFVEGYPFKETTVGRPYQFYYEPSIPAGQIRLQFFPLEGDFLNLIVELPFSAEYAPCNASCQTDCSTSETADSTDYRISISNPNDLAITQNQINLLTANMRTYVDGRCESCCDPSFAYGFDTGIQFNGTGNTDDDATITLNGTEDSVTENIVITFSDANNYTVVGDVSGALGSGVVGVAFSSPVVEMVINAGTVPFDAGDEYSLTLWRTEANLKAKTTMNPTQLCVTEATTFPPGYQNCLIWNLAEFLAPEYNMEAAPPTVTRMAITSLNNIKARNSRVPRAVIDTALRQRWLWYNVQSGPAGVSGGW